MIDEDADGIDRVWPPAPIHSGPTPTHGNSVLRVGPVRITRDGSTLVVDRSLWMETTTIVFTVSFVMMLGMEVMSVIQLLAEMRSHPALAPRFLGDWTDTTVFLSPIFVFYGIAIARAAYLARIRRRVVFKGTTPEYVDGRGRARSMPTGSRIVVEGRWNCNVRIEPGPPSAVSSVLAFFGITAWTLYGVPRWTGLDKRQAGEVAEAIRGFTGMPLDNKLRR